MAVFGLVPPPSFVQNMALAQVVAHLKCNGQPLARLAGSSVPILVPQGMAQQLSAVTKVFPIPLDVSVADLDWSSVTEQSLSQLFYTERLSRSWTTFLHLAIVRMPLFKQGVRVSRVCGVRWRVVVECCVMACGGGVLCVMACGGGVLCDGVWWWSVV